MWHAKQRVERYMLTTTLADERRQQSKGGLALTAEDCRQKLQANPDHAPALHRLGQLARETGQLEEAIALIFRSLQVNGENVVAITDLADLLRQTGQVDEALDFYRAALEAAPHDAGIHVKVGSALGAAGKWDEAQDCFQKALKLNPQSAAAHGNLGWAYQSQGDLELAIASYRQAKRLSPDSEQIMANLGGCLVQAGRLEEAVEVLSRGVAKFPRSADALSNLAAAYTGLGRNDEATRVGWKAVELNPRSANALNNLGNALKAKGEYPQAIGCFSKALEINPDGFIAYGNLGATLSEMGRSADALACLQRARDLAPANATIFSNYLLTLNYQPDVAREVLFAEHQRFETLFAKPLSEDSEPHNNSVEPERRLRIGYVSADFRDHPVANFVEPMLGAHSSAEFEVFCYANQRVNDAVTERLRGQVQHWRNVGSLSDAELEDLIRRDQIDILVDLSGHTCGNRLLAFARKPAPVQVSMIGYMQTTGMSAMDYRVTDENMDPTGVSDGFSSEKLVRLATGAATFRPPVQCPEVNESPVVENGYVTFGSFNNLAKVTPEVIAAWTDILRAVPDSRLLVVGRAGSAIQETLQAAGIAPERLQMLERQPMQEYLRLHHEVDIVLDTFPYNGGTTNLLAIWMGVPFITLAGTTPVGRAGTNLLRGLGLAELSASDAADYVQRAIAVAGDVTTLAIWRRELRGKLQPLLGDGAVYTRELEAAYRTMWRSWCAQAEAKPVFRVLS
jgi:protein O-GlcNAc transferase